MDLDRGHHESRGWIGGISCPFHGEDRNGSAAYNPELGRFRCHTCGIAGDGYDVIKAVEGISDFSSLLERARQIAGGAFVAVEEAAPAGRSRLAARKGSAARRKLVRRAYGR